MPIFNISNGRAVYGTSILSKLTLGAALAAVTLAGCKGNSNTASTTDATANDPNAPDPSQANMAPVDTTQGTTQVAGYSQAAQPTQQSYSNAAPIVRQAPSDSGYQGSSDPNYNSGDNDAEAGYDATLDAETAPQPPPPLPDYSQPPAPDPGYIWTPGYWSYTPQGYYWVPGAWTQPPYTGALWTPGYWGGYGSGYRFHHGFWAAHIGFYGGINYGFGYVGIGYQGGYWNGPHFFYNQYANNINININPGFRESVYQRNVVVNNTVINNRIVNNTTYNNTTINNTRINNVSYNGGRGGIAVQPRPAELAVLHEQRVAPMQAQVQHQQQAAQNRQQFFAQNHGRPEMAAATQPLRADHGIAAPAHTTAQINRSLPVTQQIQQERQFVHPASAPANAMRPAAPNQPNRGVEPAQARPNQPENRAMQPANRPAPQAPARTEAPQQQRAVPERRAPEPQTMRPQQPARPQAEAQRPQPAARPAPAARPEPQARPQPQPRPQAQPHPPAQQHPPAHPEQHTEPHGHP